MIQDERGGRWWEGNEDVGNRVPMNNFGSYSKRNEKALGRGHEAEEWQNLGFNRTTLTALLIIDERDGQRWKSETRCEAVAIIHLTDNIVVKP